MSIVDQEIYEKKYIKYKTKYFKLKEQYGQAPIISKGYICNTWKYFFWFGDSDDTYLESQLNINDTLDYSAFKKEADYESFLLEEQSIGEKVGFNILALSIGSGRTGAEYKKNRIREKYINIMNKTDGKLYTSSKAVHYLRIPANISVANINLEDPLLINKVNKLISSSEIKYKDEKISKVYKIFSFFGNKLNNIYLVTYGDQYNTDTNFLEMTIKKDNTKQLTDIGPKIKNIASSKSTLGKTFKFMG